MAEMPARFASVGVWEMALYFVGDGGYFNMGWKARRKKEKDDGEGSAIILSIDRSLDFYDILVF